MCLFTSTSIDPFRQLWLPFFAILLHSLKRALCVRLFTLEASNSFSFYGCELLEQYPLFAIFTLFPFRFDEGEE